MPEIRIGTSGFAYREWRGSFYPPKVPQNQFLEYYASRFRAVEIDATFYRMPSRTTLDRWVGATPDDFRFAIKASRRITHWERLRLPSEALDYFKEVLAALGERLGVVLFQLPPNFRADLERLALFLDELGDGLPAAFEFRHESWFDDAACSLLERSGKALVVHDSDAGTTPLRLTTGMAYVRLRRSGYSGQERKIWTERFRQWREDGADVYAFLKHEDSPDAPEIATEFVRSLGKSGSGA
jgi:uncharacterized protein YecE (DUF72 family)